MCTPEKVEERPTPTNLILDAINEHLARVVTCTLPQAEVQELNQAFVEEIMTDQRIKKEDLVNFLREAILSGKPIVNPNQHVSPYHPAQAERHPFGSSS